MNKKTRWLAQMSLMAAVIVIFHLFAMFSGTILPTSINLSLVAIAICSISFGYKGALILGAVSGLTTLLLGVFGVDKFTNILFNAQPLATALICLVKIMAAALVCTAVYKLISKKNETVAKIVASLCVPIVNTGIFIIGGLTLVADTLTANFVAEGASLFYFVVVTCCLVNFIMEFAISAVLSPAVVRITKLFNK